MGSSINHSRSASHGSSGSISASSAGENGSNEMTGKRLDTDLRNGNVSLDSGFSKLTSPFSSKYLPLIIKRRSMYSESSRAHDFSSNFERSSTSSDSGQNVYKFKKYITQRFSLEEKVQTSNTSSSSCNEEQNARRFTLMTLNNKYNREATLYSSSSNDSYNQSLQHDKREGCNIGVATKLPGFILHPSGTHYVPVSVHPDHVADSSISTKNYSSAMVFTPISIPVSFYGTCNITQ